MSWRDETPQAVQDDLDLLAADALSAARRFLEGQRGAFHPFGVRLANAADAPEMVTADLDLLYEATEAMREGTRAVAFASAVETADGDAIRVELEHRDGGPALVLLLPYRRRRLRRAVEVGELTAAHGERRVWTGAGPLT